MKIIAMLSYYDEQPNLLKRSVRGLARLGVDTIIAADGAYALYPDGKPYSSPETIHALCGAARDRRIHLILHQPDDVWAGNEVEKRQTMLDLAVSWSDVVDWLVVWDCDYKLLACPWKFNLKDRLQVTSCDVATIAFTEDPRADGEHDFYPMGMFLRAQRGIRMDGNHHTYLLPHGRRTQVLRRPVENEADALHMPDVKVLHDVHQRDPERRARQTAYYEQRDALGVES
jgi:hypothetical protein